MTRKVPHMRLGLILLVCTILSLALAVGVYFAGNALGGYLVDQVFCTETKLQEAEKEIISNFHDYVAENQITSTDEAGIQRWVSEQRDLIVAVYDMSNSFFPSSYKRVGRVYSSFSDSQSVYDLLKQSDSERASTYAFAFADDVAIAHAVSVIYVPMYRMSGVVTFVTLALAFLTFVLMLLLLIHRKTRYIVLLSRELQTLQGGQLECPVTIRGNDELTSLARDIDGMRQSFIRRLENENNMRNANSGLMTAMSHDLRTPLTSLMGYLDIIDLGKCESEEQMRKYIHSSKQKAYQIKEMTDKLFEYFLVYSTEEESVEMETLDAQMLFGQLVEENQFMLEAEGFTVTVDQGEGGGGVKVYMPFIQRVFDNIFSNIRKYADKSAPVTIAMRREDNTYQIEMVNAVGVKSDRADSSGIGLGTCEKIMKRHDGTFSATEADGRFTCRMCFPLVTGQQAA